MTLALPPDHHDHPDHELEEHDRGLVYDLATLDRRQMLKLLGFGGLSAGLFVIAGCGPTGAPPASASASSAPPPAPRRPSARAARSSPRRRPGPFPGDGSNGPDVLTQSGVVRERHPLELRVVERRSPRACR